MKSGLGISGHVKIYITDNITGKKRLVFDDHNAIQAAYATAIVDELDSGVGQDYHLDNLFNGMVTPPTAGEDGIVIKDNGSGNWYEMTMSTPVKTNYTDGSQVLFVGTFTGAAITISAAADINLGWNYATPFTIIIAIPNAAGWAAIPVLITEKLTIEWIIKHQKT